jgi:Tfp pilus assembly protein PilF
MEVSKNYKQDSLRKIEQARIAMSEEDYGKGVKLANSVLDEDFDNPLALFLVAYALMKTEKFGAAYHLFRRCAELEPDRTGPWNNAGLCHQETWNLDDAEMCFREALKRDPEDEAALQNLALICINRCQPKEALKWIRLAEKTGSSSWHADDNKALALLMLGQWKEGWQAYRSTAGRHKQRELRTYRTPEEPMWNGEPGTVVVYGNQGLGDEIAFASCIPDAMAKNEVIVECDHRLEGLFKRSFATKVYGTRFKPRAWDHAIDYSIPSDCLPSLYRNEDKDFPGTPYLKADPERRIQWRALFDTLRKPVIGVAWTGGLKNTGSVKRSLTLEQLAPVFNAIDATWVSLEYKDRSEELEDFYLQSGVRILDYPRATRTQDYDDTAGLVAELDLVISATTAVVHLAGALGKECWCLAPNKPRFFYGLQGDVLWYKSVKMFRQEREWPINDVVRLLKLRYA